MDEFVPNRGGPRYHISEEAPPDNGPDNHPRTWTQQIDGFSDEDPDYGPSDDKEKPLEWRHSKRDKTLTLKNNYEKCTLTAEGYAVKAIFEQEPPVDAVFAVYRPTPRTWHPVSAFVSTHERVLSSRSHRNEDDKWVVKIVYCLNTENPHVKWIRNVFETRYSDSDDMRESLRTWVLERGFDFLLEDIEY
jgi:hypothetical protein